MTSEVTGPEVQAPLFSAHEWNLLALLFEPSMAYAGYRPQVYEVPNGDGVRDSDKRYLHVALKYNPPAWAVAYLAQAHFLACRVAEALRVPAAYYPRVADATLRVLEYPAGAGSAEHTDFDLFTVPCYRSDPSGLELTGGIPVGSAATALAPGLHIGEIGALVGLGPATPHRVVPRPRVQRSIVYFAMPDHAAVLPGEYRETPDGSLYMHSRGTVGEWLQARMARSRVYR